jgi:threonylcarbamoyladenosine tRNA methylthiotransferase MtaB
MLNTAPHFLIKALGCKISQYDAAALKRALLARGFIYGGEPELIIINTCAVTKSAITKDRQTVRQWSRSFPAAKLVVMGCWPQTYDDAAKSLNLPNILFWGVGQTRELVNELENIFADRILKAADVLEEGLLVPLARARYFLKVGDGCNQFCSYCIIPYARGPIKSRSLAELKMEVSAATAAGYGEIILSGIHLGRYGQDFKTGESLVSLLKNFLEVENLGRLRLSSIEINEVDEELMALIKDNPRLCRHLHISLQSGSDKILKAMRRPYTTAYFKNRIETLRNLLPEIAITTDIIVGFPGETEADFQETLNFAKEINFSKIHVFSFSAHEKTPAFFLPDQVRPEVIKDRSERLRALSDLLEKDYETKIRQLYAGRKLAVIIENVKDGLLKGKSEFHVDFKIPAASLNLTDQAAKRLIGQLVDIYIN